MKSEKQLMTIKSVIETYMTDEAVVKWKDSFEQKEQEQEQQDILKLWIPKLYGGVLLKVKKCRWVGYQRRGLRCFACQFF